MLFSYIECPQAQVGRQLNPGRTADASSMCVLCEPRSLGLAAATTQLKKRGDGEGHLQDPPQCPALTVQLTAKELKAEGAASTAGQGKQPHVLRLQREAEHVGLQATIVHISHKHLGGRGSV